MLVTWLHSLSMHAYRRKQLTFCLAQLAKLLGGFTKTKFSWTVHCYDKGSHPSVSSMTVFAVNLEKICSANFFQESTRFMVSACACVSLFLLLSAFILSCVEAFLKGHRKYYVVILYDVFGNHTLPHFHLASLKLKMLSLPSSPLCFSRFSFLHVY